MERLLIGMANGTRCNYIGFKGTLEDLKNSLEEEFKIQHKEDITSREIVSVESFTEGVNFSYIWHGQYGEIITGFLPPDKEIDLTIFVG
jgi:hypothetical protein